MRTEDATMLTGLGRTGMGVTPVKVEATDGLGDPMTRKLRNS